MSRKRPTRRDLLVVVGRRQGMIGEARGIHENDRRGPHAFARAQEILREAADLCVAARGYDPPLDGAKSRGGWGDG